MKIYCVTSIEGSNLYFSGKRAALSEAREIIGRMKAQGDSGYVEIIECHIERRLNAAFLCDILTNYGADFADDQATIYYWNLNNGEIEQPGGRV